MPQAYGTPKVIYYNVDQRKLCDAAGTPLASGSDRLFLTSFGKYVLKMTFLNDDGTAAEDWSGQVAFWGAVDNNFNHSLDCYVTVLNSAFNVAGDWVVDGVEQPNPETGKLCCRIDLSDSRLDANLAAAEGGNYDFEIHGLRVGDDPACILRIPLYIENIQQKEASTSYPSDDLIWVSHADLAASLAYYLNLDQWHGEWDSGHNYVYGDIVKKFGHIYIAIQASLNQAPSETADTAYWILWSENGATGDPGTAGTQVLGGDYAPDAGTGDDGDWYIDTYYYNCYGPKTGGAWSSYFSMKGDKGDDGLGWNKPLAYNAATTYTDTDSVTYNGSIYGSLQNGNVGHTPGSSPTWWVVLVTKGEDGADGSDGTDGTDGADGTQIYVQTYNPSAGDGVDGDLWINSLTGGLYNKDSGAWTLIYTLDNGGFLPWENDDIDTGIETLVEFDAPDEGACWKVYGIVGKASTGQIAFDLLVSLRVEGASKTVKVAMHQTTADGSVTGLAWGSDIYTPYTDYDSGTDKVRVRLYVPSDNWTAAGKYLRGA